MERVGGIDMWCFVIIAAVICVAFFIWTNRYCKKCRKEAEKEKADPVITCRSEDSLQEYGKKLDEPSCPEPEE